MFGALYNLTNNAKALDENQIFIKLVSEQQTKDLILHLNRIEQLFERGIDSAGKITGVYTEFTEFINQGKSFSFEGHSKRKIAGEPYLLFDSGFFYNSFNVRVYKDGFTITANDETEDGTELARKFGRKILGLTTQSTNELVKNIEPKFIKETRKQLFG